MEQTTLSMEARLTELRSQITEKDNKLSQSEEEVIKLTKKCAELMTKELKSGGDGDSWSLGSAGSFTESDSVEIRSLKEKLIKLKQNEELLKTQLEVLQSTIQIMIHPEDIEEREKKLKKEVSELELQRDELLVTNLQMKTGISEVDDLKTEMKKLRESDERKTGVIEELHEKLEKFGEQNSVLLESLQETESAEQSLRDSLTRIHSSDNVSELAAAAAITPDEIKKYRDKETHYLHRLDSMEEKDKSLRDRLAQVEEQERKLEQELESVRAELELAKDINTSQEQTILQQQQSDQKSANKIKELEKKCSNMKLLMSQKMDELEYSRKSIKSLEKDMSDMQPLRNELETLKEKTRTLSEELALARDINTSQEDTIKQLQTTHTPEVDDCEADLTQSYSDQLNRQQAAEDAEEIHAEYQRETNQLRHEIDSLNSKSEVIATQHDKEISALQTKVSQAEKEVEAAKSKYQIAQGVIDELKSQNKKLANDGKRDYEDRIKDLNTKLQSEKVQNSVHRDVIASMSPQIERLNCENEAHEASNKSLQEKLSQAESEISKKKAECDSLQSKMSSFEKKLESAQANQVSSEDLAKARLDLDNKTAESDNLAVDLIQMTDKCAELEKRLESANKDLRSTETKRTELQKHCDNYSQQLSTLQEKTRQAEQTRADLDIKTAECQESDVELKKSRADLTELQTQLRELEKQHQEEVDTAESYRTSLTAANQKVEELKTAQEESMQASALLEGNLLLKEEQIESLNEKLKDVQGSLTKQMDSSCADCMSKLDTIADQALELEQARSEVEKLTEEVSSLNSNILSSTEQYTELQAQAVSLEAKHAERTATLESQDQNLAELQALVICAAKDIQGLECENQVLVDKLHASEAQQQSVEAEMQKVMGDHNRNSSQASQHQSLISSLRVQVTNLNSELNHTNQQNVQTVETLKKQIYTLTQEKNALQNRNDKLVIEVDKILSEKQVYIDEIEQLASELKSHKDSSSKSITSLQVTIDEQSAQLQQLSSSTADNDDADIESDTKVKVLSEANVKLQNELDSMSLTLSEVIQERDELSDKIDVAEDETSSDYSNLQVKLRDLQTVHDELVKQQHDMVRDNHRLNSMVSELECDNARLTDEVKEAGEAVSRLNQSVEEERNKGIYLTNKQTEKHKSDLEVLQESLNEMTEDRDELKRRLAAMRKPAEDNTHVNKLTAELEDLRSKNQSLNKHLETLHNEHLDQLSSASADSSILQAQLENMTEDMNELQKEVKLTSNLKSLSTELQNRLKDEKKAHNETSLELKSLKAEQMTFKEQVEDLKERLEHSQQKCEELTTELSQSEDSLSAQAERHQIEQDKLQEKITTSYELIQELEQRLQSETCNQTQSSTQKEDMEQELTELNEAIAEKDKEIEEKCMLNDDLSNQLRNAQTKIGELSDEMLDAQLRITELQSNVADQSEISQLQTQLKDQKAATDLARAAVNALKETPPHVEETEELRTKISSQEEYIEALQSDSKMLTDQIEFMKNENDDLSARVSDLYETVGELENITAQNTRLTEECEHVKDRLTASDKRTDELTNQLNVMESKKRSIEDELDDVQTSNLSLVAQVGEAKEQAKREMEDQLEAQLKEELEANVRRLEDKVRNQDQALELLKRENDDLISQLIESKAVSSVQIHSAVGPENDQDVNVVNIRMALKEKEVQIAELEKSLDVHRTYHSAAEQVTEEKVTNLTAQNNEKDDKCRELEDKNAHLQQQLDEFLADDSESESEEVDYQRKYLQSRNHIEVLEFDYASIEAKYKEATDAKIDLGLQVASLKGERDRLAAQVRASPRMDQENADGVEYRGLQRQVIDLKQKLQNQKKESEGSELEKSDFARKLQVEKNATLEAKEATKVAEAEARKLQMSISMLMTSHETEMSSLQKALHNAGAKMGDLEVRVADYSQHSDDVHSLIGKVNNELKEMKAAKESISSLMSDLVTQNNSATTQFQRQLCTLLSQITPQQEAEERTSDLSMSLPMDPPLQSTLNDIKTLPNLSSTPAPNLSDSLLLSMKTEPLSTVSHYGRLSKEDLVAKLSDQTKHELILRKTLDESRQSLTFYRSAIDNIIDCLGTSMPGVKKWANDFLNSEDQAFSQHLDAIISNESALQRRCHALEMNEKALTESFETKESEYQSAIQRLQDMVSVLKSSKDKLQEELKLKTSSTSSAAEEQVTALKEKMYELEATVKRLRLQNEELQFAFEQECERRQIQEEERFKAEQKSRLSTVDAVRESEYLSKISSLESKITQHLRAQHQLENTIDSLRHDSREDDLRLQIETLERSERALLRKIEILQQSESTISSTQYENSLDRPEDILRQKIWEMEKMEIHLKQQVSDLEHDREELHEIARSDKNEIHELNIQIAEAQLANKNLKAQIARYEQAEEVLYTKLESSENRIADLEEKLKEALDNEKTMRFQLEDVEYSEDNLRFRTGNMEKSLDTLQANEALLKKRIDDLNNERDQTARESESWRGRIRILEDDLKSARNDLIETGNREITLKGRISELAAMDASLNIRIRELELENEQLTSKLLHLEKSAGDLRENLSDTFLGKDELNSQIQNIRTSERSAKSKISEVETEKFELEKELQDIKFKYIQLQSQTNQEGHDSERYSERLVTAVANEKQLKGQVVRLEAVVAAYESRQTSGIVERENFQLSAENKNLKDKVKMKERDLRDMEEKISRLTSTGNAGGGGTYRINKLQTDIKDLQSQLKQSEEIRQTLEKTIDKVKDGKNMCGHEAEMVRLRLELDHLRGQLKNARTRSSGWDHPTPAHYKETAVRDRNSQGLKRETAKPKESVRTRCLDELVAAVKQREERIQEEEIIVRQDVRPVSGKPFTKYQAESVSEHDEDDEVAEVSDAVGCESEGGGSLWEKLEPPVRRSPLTLNSAVIIKPETNTEVSEELQTTGREIPANPVVRPSSPVYAASIQSTSDIAEESSLWEKLELYEPKKKPEIKTPKVDLEFEEGPIAPKYAPRKALSPPFMVPAIDVGGRDSADEVSELEDIAVIDSRPVSSAPFRSVAPPTESDQTLEAGIEQPARAQNLSSHTSQAMETRDIARLRQTIADLEKRLKSRDTEIRMLRSTQKEIERDTNLSGDVFTMKAKLKSLQEQVDNSDKKISALRNEVISRDKNLTNRQKEIVDLRLELRKHSSLALPKPEDQPSVLLSPGSRQRPIQMCTSPGRQTTIERDPAELYKTMVESKEAHIQQLTKQLEEKKSAMAKLERDLTDVKISTPSHSDPDAAKFKYLDDKYTETATKCYNMKLERDDWKRKYEELNAEHQQPSTSLPPQTRNGTTADKKCPNCKHLKREIRRLQKELHAARKRLAQRVLQAHSSMSREHAIDDLSVTSEQTLTQSEAGDDVTSIDSMPDDVINYVLDSTADRLRNNSSLTNGTATTLGSRSFESPGSRSRSQSPTKSGSRFQRPRKQFRPRYYDAISDYNPQFFSTSGRMEKEVPLMHGQRVKVLEEADDMGYSKAEINNKIVLVPMKYLQLVDLDKLDRERVMNERKAQLQQLSNTTDFSSASQNPTYSEAMSMSRASLSPQQRDDNIRSSPLSLSRPRVESPLRTLPVTQVTNNRLQVPMSSAQSPVSPRTITKQLRKPRAPTGLRVEIVANQKLYIEWAYVQHLDHEMKSNGTIITGFRVFLNGRSVSDIRSPYTTVCSMEVSPSLLADLHTVSVQATGETNLNSSLTHTTVSPYLESPNLSARHTPSPSLNNSASLNGSPPRKRLFMAYYDYDPVKQGPYSRGFKKTCNDELALKTGDFVVVHGDPKANGFYLAEVNGRSGHVPESFIRQVPAENAKHYGYYENDAHLPR